MLKTAKKLFKSAIILIALSLTVFTGCKKESKNATKNDTGAGTNMLFTRQSGIISGAGGSSVAISADGKTAVAGNPSLNDGLGGALGYTRNGDNWTLQATLIGTGYSGEYNGYSPRNGASPAQGTSVAISSDGNTIISGGDYDNYWGSAAFIFVRNGNTWSQQGPALDSYFSESSDLDASSVSISSDGNTAVVEGGLGSSSGGIMTSRVYLFSRSAGSWENTTSIAVDAGTIDNLLNVGQVAISGDGNTLAIGKRKPHGTFLNIDYDGSIDMYIRSGNQWVKNINGQNLKPSNVSDNYGFGQSIAISDNGSSIIVGAQGSVAKGGAYVFTSVLKGPWVQYGDAITKDIDATKFYNVGGSVSMAADGNSVIINGNIIEKDPSPELSGQDIIFFYDLKSNKWVREGDYIINDQSFDYGTGISGYALSISADAKTILAGNVLSSKGKGGGYINFFYR